jgi:hypothetical protein
MSEPIYYLVSVSGNDENDYEEYIMAISYNKEVLENMIDEHTKLDQCFTFVIKENLKIQNFLGYSANKTGNFKLLFYENYDICNISEDDKLYAYNLVNLDNIVENRLLRVYKKDLDKFKTHLHNNVNNISTNPIEFNTYYEEGIMNA